MEDGLITTWNHRQNSSKNVGLQGKNKTIKLPEDSTADFTTSRLHNSEEHKYFSNAMPKAQTIEERRQTHIYWV